MISEELVSQLIAYPRERVEVEYKRLVKPEDKCNKAKIAKHAIALAQSRRRLYCPWVR